MNETAHTASREPSPPRRITDRVCAGAFWTLGLLFVTASWDVRLPDNPHGVLLLFGIGILCGIGAGIFLGRDARRTLRKGDGDSEVIFLLAFFSVLVCILLCRPSSASSAPATAVLLNSVWLVSIPCLLAADGYLLGWFLLPGRVAIPGRKRLLFGLLLYGSPVVGISIGFRADLWQRGTVPFDAYQPRGKASAGSLKEAVANIGDPFPSDLRVVSRRREIYLPHFAPPQVASHSRLVDVIEATSSVVTVRDRTIEFLGYKVFPPHRGPLDKNAVTATSWDLDGNPIEDLPESDLPSPFLNDVKSSSLSWFPLCTVVLSSTESTGEMILGLTQQPGDYESGRLRQAFIDGLSTETFELPLPVSGAAELVAQVQLSGWNQYRMPPREGAQLPLDSNRLLLARLYPWAWEKVVELQARRVEQRPGEPPRGHTTAVFLCAAPGPGQSLVFDCVLDNGEIVNQPSPVRSQYGWIVCDYPVSVDQIESFRIREQEGPLRIRWRIPKLHGMPDGNGNCDNLLDLVFPYLDFPAGQAGAVDRFLRRVLRGRLENEGYAANVPSIHREKVTVRELLDHYYPNRWWVKNGVVRTTRERFGPIVWKVRGAVRNLSG